MLRLDWEGWVKAEAGKQVGHSQVRNAKMSPYEEGRLLADRAQENRKGTDREGVRHQGKASLVFQGCQARNSEVHASRPSAV